VDAVLDNLGHDLFPFSISSNDVENTKPHPDCYLKAASMTESNIQNCLVFEDSLTGMNAATSSGAFLIAVPHLVTIEESKRVRVISTLEQLNFAKLTQLFADFSSAI
jgi:beta-phosphoglucomutase-like phosphatase (HAD superfamily)